MLLGAPERATPIMEGGERAQPERCCSARGVFLRLRQHRAEAHTINSLTSGVSEAHMLSQGMPLLPQAGARWAIKGAELLWSSLHGHICQGC